MRIIGITGGVGSGKSEVLNYLKKRYAAKIMEADKTGHELLSDNKEIAASVEAIFGKTVLDGEGRIDREKLGRESFGKNDKIEALNQIIHPAVKRVFLSEVERAEAEGCEVFVIEAALLIECGYKKEVDCLWYIYCDKEVRIERLMKNRGYSREKSLNIMKNQISEQSFRKNCDVVIDNSGDLTAMYSQVDLAMSKGVSL